MIQNFKLAPQLNNNNFSNNDTKWKLADPLFNAINQILTTTFKYISSCFLSNLCYISISDLFLIYEGQIKGKRIRYTKSGDNFTFLFLILAIFVWEYRLFI